MRKALIFIVLIPIFGLFMASCSDDNDEPNVQFWYSFATQIKDNSANGYYFDLDSGGKLLPTNSLDITDFNDTSRVVVTYSIASDVGEGEARVIEGEIKLIREILTKDIFQLTEENVDSIGNDFLYTNENSIWNAGSYLNVVFSYYGYNEIHYINLCKPIGIQKDTNDYQILELRHNGNNDFESYYYQSEVSFNMMSLQEPGMDSINFVLKVIEGDTNNFIYYGTFHFTNNDPVSKIVPKENIDLNAKIE